MSGSGNVQQTAVCCVVTLLAISATVIAQNISDAHAPYINLSPRPHILYNAGRSVELKCDAEGIPAPTYEWYKDNVRLERDADVENGDLWLRTVKHESQGYYQCRAKNAYGTAISAVSFLQEAELERQGPFQQLAWEVVVDAGHSVTLPCNHTVSIPRARFIWYTTTCVRCHDNVRTPVLLNDRVTIDEKGSLVFGRVEMSDADVVYTCKAENHIRSRVIHGSYTRLVVIPNPHHQNLRTVPTVVFTTESPRIILEGEDVTLKCFFSGWPIPNVTWATDEGDIDTSRMTISESTHELTIHNVRESDTGHITCWGDNGIPSKPSQILLSVDALPNIIYPPQNMMVVEGSNVTYQCIATGRPAVEIDWYINEHRIEESDRVSIWTMNQDRSELTLSSLTLRDHFTVSCNASNNHGYQLKGAYLSVVPRPPTEPPTTSSTREVTTPPETTSAATTTTQEHTTQAAEEVTTVEESQASITNGTLPEGASGSSWTGGSVTSTPGRKTKPTGPTSPKVLDPSDSGHENNIDKPIVSGTGNGHIGHLQHDDKDDEEYQGPGSNVIPYVVPIVCFVLIILVITLIIWYRRKRRQTTYEVERREQARVEYCRRESETDHADGGSETVQTE